MASTSDISSGDRGKAVAIVLLAVTVTTVLVFVFIWVFGSTGGGGWDKALPNLGLAVIPNMIGVLAVFLVVDRLRVYGLDQTHEQTQDQLAVIHDYLHRHVTHLSAQLEVAERLADVPWREIFVTAGPIGVVANFATLPFDHGKNSIRQNFHSTRNGHVFVLADPEIPAVVEKIAKSRELLTFANDPLSVRTAICETIALLVEALPDGVSSTDSTELPGIRVLLSSRIIGFSSYWTDEVVCCSGLQTIPEEDCTVPRVIAHGDSSVALRGYSRELIDNLMPDLRRPSIAQLLELGSAVRNSNWIDRTRARIIH